MVYHTYSTYARGLDGLWGMYQWLDRAPKGLVGTGYSRLAPAGEIVARALGVVAIGAGLFLIALAVGLG